MGSCGTKLTSAVYGGTKWADEMPTRIHPTENIAYHAGRLLILIGHAGKVKRGSNELPSITGRTLLAKMDFFMRYPAYLRRAASILGKSSNQMGDESELYGEDSSVESRMTRYLYGPWDSSYYVTLAYLIGKGLIEPPVASRVDSFRITARGAEVLRTIESDGAFVDLVHRARIVGSLFRSFNGNRLKSFIYEHFPEIVGLKLGKVI